MNPLILGKNLVKKFPNKTKPAINKVNLTICSGEIIAVVGHNGAGKTTLFDLVSGFTLPSSGTLAINIDRSKIGWCPQREIIDWSLTVRQNISLGLEIRQRKLRKQTSSIIEEVATTLGLSNYMDKTAETLSGGELRRTQIARAIAGNPQLMILDEPTTGLDPEGIEAVFKYLDDCRKQGSTALISTHETSRFSSHCTRVIAINEGKIIADLPIEKYLKLYPGLTEDLWDVYRHIRERTF
ncbi:MAG: ABC transporter ATP-binding protein [Rothia sp. (in: high G+C Gram-positive bacteria)]|nr:ABC transporter ATP-binding protein [Rothia sp. (in: high G+C Gram-positive bacteria)]